ncbi:hypothetical protein FRB98_003425 [Tulasnella sp. 332]|nr:hypothetical protein FRB98_003425 [Tulasnella sp. 332]
MSASGSAPSGREWRQAVGLTKDVQFVLATNASVLGAGIEGIFAPINDPDAVPVGSTTPTGDPETPKQTPVPHAKGKEKAKYCYVELDETPSSAFSVGPSSTASGPSTPTRQQKASAANGRPLQESEVVKDLCPHPIDLHWPSQLRMGRGLSNNGNTCFLNSVLQCLLYTPPLLHVLALHPSAECKIRPWCATCALNMIMVKNYSGERGYFSPTVITKNIKTIAASMRQGRQEDAHEFLRELIESLQRSALHHSKLPPPHNVPPPVSMTSPSRLPASSKVPPALAETTWVHKIFGGKLLSRVTCHQCRHASDKFEACLDISLDLTGARSVEQALENYVKIEQLDGKGEDRYKCEKCKVPVNAQKQLVIHQAPAVLTVHLKRFTLLGRKITRPIDYPARLNIAPYVSKGQYGPTYSLYGIISHSGSGPHSGHYVAHVKSPNGFWHEMNDEIQTGTRSQQPPLGMSQAYVLFYLQDSNTRLEAAVLGTNGNGGAGARMGMKKRKNRVDSEESEEEEEESPTRPPSVVLGGPEIAAAAARESERMSLPQRALKEKIKAAQKGMQKKNNVGVALKANPEPIPRANLVDYAGDDEDMGEPIQEQPKPPMDMEDKGSSANGFIGPVLPSGRITERTPATNELDDPSLGSVKPEIGVSSSASETRTIPSASFYGTSKPASTRIDTKRRSSPSPPLTHASYKKPRYEKNGMDSYRRRSQGLWQNNLHRESGGRRGQENIPKVRVMGPGMSGGVGIKKNQKPKKSLI